MTQYDRQYIYWASFACRQSTERRRQKAVPQKRTLPDCTSTEGNTAECSVDKTWNDGTSFQTIPINNNWTNLEKGKTKIPLTGKPTDEMIFTLNTNILTDKKTTPKPMSNKLKWNQQSTTAQTYRKKSVHFTMVHVEKGYPYRTVEDPHCVAQWRIEHVKRCTKMRKEHVGRYQ